MVLMPVSGNADPNMAMHINSFGAIKKLTSVLREGERHLKMESRASNPAAFRIAPHTTSGAPAAGGGGGGGGAGGGAPDHLKNRYVSLSSLYVCPQLTLLLQES